MLSSRSAALQSGNHLLHYRLIEPIGQGGMGVVWRAHDETLGRDVAIKVLPDVFAADPERVARFEREARVLASLNHPHIGAIYGFHSAGPVRFLALELVEGEDLAQRLERGPFTPEDAVAVARPLAEALEYAHERGVVHRDFKPANIKLSEDGRVRVLDFGLAKALDTDAAGSSVWDPGHSPTLTVALTHAQVILGTAAYMSPEQARGRPVDKRADIWAFGVVLYEMLTGRRLFDGETASDTLAAVLKTDIDWTALPPSMPARLIALLRRCLERDATKRLRDIGEARIALEQIESGKDDEPVSRQPSMVPQRTGVRRLIPVALALAGTVVGAALTAALMPSITGRDRSAGVRRFLAVVPADPQNEPAAAQIAPDASAVAYADRDGIWLRPLNDLQPRLLVRTPLPLGLTWSPDSRQIAYISGTRVYKVSIAGGDAQPVADARVTFAGGSGITWTANGTLAVTRGDNDGILEFSDRGGDPTSILAADTTREGDFHEPAALPRGRGFLYVVHTREGVNTIEAFDGERRIVLLQLPGHTLGHPKYSPTGHVVFTRSAPSAGIWAFPFSLSGLRRTGEPFLVVSAAGAPSVAGDGTLAYRTGDAGGDLQFAWLDRSGKEIASIGDPGPGYEPNPQISPDGKIVYVAQELESNIDLWAFDPQRSTKTRLSFDADRETSPTPIPGTDQIVYSAAPKDRGGAAFWKICRRAVSGGPADTLATGFVSRVSVDGRWLLYSAVAGAEVDLHAIDLRDPSRSIPIATDRDMQGGGSVSPSGDWVAYFSEESGRNEVYLKRFPSGEGKWQVSANGGIWPRWNRAGTRLYYAREDDIMEVEVGAGPNPSLSTPQKLFTRPASILWFNNQPGAFDVSGDGSRFVIMRRSGARGQLRSIAVAQNWIAEFQRKR